MRFGFIADGRVFYPVVVMCKMMKVSRSGFYSYLARVHQKSSVCEQENASLLAQIEVIFEESSKRYGSPRIHAELRKRRVLLEAGQAAHATGRALRLTQAQI